MSVEAGKCEQWSAGKVKGGTDAASPVTPSVTFLTDSKREGRRLSYGFKLMYAAYK